MVKTTDNNGSQPLNTTTNSSPSSSNDDKPSLPKRLKVEDNINQKSAVDNKPEELNSSVAPPKETAPIPEAPKLSDAPPPQGEKSSGSAVKVMSSEKQILLNETPMPWSRLISQYPENPTIDIHATNFLIGSCKLANFKIEDKNISKILSVIKLKQVEGSSFAMFERIGNMGSVQINKEHIMEGKKLDLKSGDELVFGETGNHAYVSLYSVIS
ncbi:hypothetical protein LIER_30229 [Lithospermum erythrorhizon]|uniref:FHA domain-containing protein n=1 Tax=Lithospermum erythrorhizon TaxID=34254 RepID=A0AAV3RM04_LITER